MASVLELLLHGEVSPETVVKWLKSPLTDGIPESLESLQNVKQEFIPFFLNYLRDHTTHLLQSSKSATPSPAKTPSLKKLQKSVKRKKDNGGKRQQLFGSSPAGDVDDLRNLPSSVFSPNTSLDSPCGVYQRGDKNQSKGNFKSNFSSQKYSPQCGSQRSPYMQQTPEQRSKQKLSLGEFMHTPESSAPAWKKKSPHSGGRREFTTDNSPSPVFGHGRKSGSRRKQSNSPLIQNHSTRTIPESSTPPVFSLTSSSDFPPMGNKGHSLEETKYLNCRSLNTDTNKSNNNSSEFCDTKISRVINFSNPDPTNSVSPFSCNKLQVLKPISPVNITTSTPSTRRITPTLVKVDNSIPQNSAFLVPIEEHEKCANTAPVMKPENAPTDNESRVDLLEEHKLLQQERMRRQSQSSETCTSVLTPTKLRLEHSSSIVETVEASLREVTHQEKLDLIMSLYSRCLDENLLPNLIVELYFLVQLLTARGGEEEDTFMYGEDVIEENYFSTVHNTVYFAVSIFDMQKRLLGLLDRGTLRLLSENHRIATFSTSLQKNLEKQYENAEAQRGPAYPRSPIGSVSFQADTDNRKNFPNDKSFHTFKRQRDGFYELIRLWEASHMNPNYNMEEMFGSRVKSLVNVKTDLANHIHFARLFQSQLIAMCKGDGPICSNEEDENITLLSQLKRTNPEKFKRLQERFIKPLSVGGPCPLPSFPGIQEFFRDFIIVACNPLFNQHLCDTFAAKVLELNETAFTNNDDEDAAADNGDDEERDVFCSVLQSVRLVGKFLGFVTFLPYQSPDRVPDSMESKYISIRSKHQPPMDMLEHLYTAFQSGTLSLTVPWVVEFLSMMDSMAPNLDHYNVVLFLLLCIHRHVWSQMRDELCYSSLMVVSVISWLLEIPIIPDGFFFSEMPNGIQQRVKGLLPSLGSLDYRNFVNQSLFYTCCPYMGEMKALLVEFAVGSSSKMSSIRKITPVSADIPSQKSLTQRQLQLQMEENFFHNHPASMKRVVDFVADRSASNFIKKFRGSLLQESLTEGKERVVKQLMTMTEGSPSSKLKDRVSQVTCKVAHDLFTKVRVKVTTEAPKYCHECIPSLMTLLLPDDQSATVINMASAISERIGEEKILQWLNKHITVAMYQAEIMPDIDKISRSIIQLETVPEVPNQSNTKLVTQSASQVTGHVMAATHDIMLPHPSEVLIDLKDCVKNLVLRNKPVTLDKVFQLLQATRLSLQYRQDILPGVFKAFGQLTVELLLSILIHAPDNYTDLLVHKFVMLWTSVLRESTLGLIFSGRVVQMIQNAQQSQTAWERYNKLLVTLLEHQVIEPAQIQETCLKFAPNVQDELTVVMTCQCLCQLAAVVPEIDRAESLGVCLELLYDMLPSNKCDEAVQILKVLGVTNNNNVIDVETAVSKVKL